MLARCYQDRRLFGIRLVERAPDNWNAVWAFDVDPEYAKRERYDETALRGAFSYAPGYPGCAYCRSPGLLKCTCGQLTCWSGKRGTYACAWCDFVGRAGGTVDTLTAGGDL